MKLRDQFVNKIIKLSDNTQPKRPAPHGGSQGSSQCSSRGSCGGQVEMNGFASEYFVLPLSTVIPQSFLFIRLSSG